MGQRTRELDSSGDATLLATTWGAGVGVVFRWCYRYFGQGSGVENGLSNSVDVVVGPALWPRPTVDGQSAAMAAAERGGGGVLGQTVTLERREELRSLSSVGAGGTEGRRRRGRGAREDAVEERAVEVHHATGALPDAL